MGNVPLPSVSNFIQDPNAIQPNRNNLAVNNANLINSTLTPNSDDFFAQNSNFGDLFDPNSVMAAINEFNPIAEMGAPNSVSMDSFGQNGLNGTMGVGNMDNGLRSNVNMQGNNNMNNLVNGMQGIGNNGTFNNNMSHSNTSIYDNMTGVAGPAMMNMGNMDGGFAPKIEDGFTELQDFTIWD